MFSGPRSTDRIRKINKTFPNFPIFAVKIFCSGASFVRYLKRNVYLSVVKKPRGRKLTKSAGGRATNYGNSKGTADVVGART